MLLCECERQLSVHGVAWCWWCVCCMLLCGVGGCCVLGWLGGMYFVFGAVLQFLLSFNACLSCFMMGS